jgi:hypothetical protein
MGKFKLVPDMLGQVLSLDWTENNSVSALTVAPKFDPGTSRTLIANDYFNIINGAIMQKRLLTSAFLQEALSRLKMGAGSATPWTTKPVTPLEKQILSGMEFSLN